VLARYQDCCLVKDRSLVYTVAPVLWHSSYEPPTMAHRFLQLASPPPLPLVLAHVQNVCRYQSLDAWPVSLSSASFAGTASSGSSSSSSSSSSLADGCTPAVVFGDICRFLSDELRAKRLAAPGVVARLRECALVPIGNRLLRASRLFFRLRHVCAGGLRCGMVANHSTKILQTVTYLQTLSDQL
jgi:hypothetical protein